MSIDWRMSFSLRSVHVINKETANLTIQLQLYFMQLYVHGVLKLCIQKTLLVHLMLKNVDRILFSEYITDVL